MKRFVMLGAVAAALLTACVVRPSQQPANGYPSQTYGNGQPGNPQSAPGWSGGGGGQPGYGGQPGSGGQPGYENPPPPGYSGGSTGSPDTGVISVTIRSSCPNTVRVFFGSKPKYGSGTYGSISANSVQSYQMRQGDMIWLVDQNDEGVSSFSASPAVNNAEINSACTGFLVH